MDRMDEVDTDGHGQTQINGREEAQKAQKYLQKGTKTRFGAGRKLWVWELDFGAWRVQVLVVERQHYNML